MHHLSSPKNLLCLVSLIEILLAGPVSPQDIKARREGINTTHETNQDKSQGQPSSKTQKPAGGSFGSSYQWMDADGDGRISKAEFDAAFKKMDANRDGYLSAEELRSSTGHPAAGTGNSPRSHPGKSTGPHADTRHPIAR